MDLKRRYRNIRNDRMVYVFVNLCVHMHGCLLLGLVSLSCSTEYDVAFQNFRMLQGFGASLAFFFSAFMCVYVKLCTLMALLVLSVVFYVAAEYHIRKPENVADQAVVVSPR